MAIVNEEELLASVKPIILDELQYNLLVRKAMIETFKGEMVYICRQLKSFNQDVEHILLMKMPKSMISNNAYNLVHHLVVFVVELSVYDYLNTSYLLVENYNDNFRGWRFFKKFSNETTKLINKLEEENIFEIDEDKIIDGFLDTFLLCKKYGKTAVRSHLNLQHILSKINGKGIFTALLVNMRAIERRLEIIKSGLYDLNDKDFLTIYKANYNFYKENYWPEDGNNFREQVMSSKPRFEDFNADYLKRCLWAERNDFFSTESGKLWRDYSSDKKRLYFRSKSIMTEDQWLYFFKCICRFEAYEDWIEELNTPFTNKRLRDFVVRPNIADVVVNKITSLIKNETKPKPIVRPFRAAMDAGVLHRPTWDAFVAEYGEGRIKSDASFNSYTNPETKPYTGSSYDVLVNDFKKLLE